MIVIAGGTGTLGTRLVPYLTGQGRAVRVLTRDPARARHLTGTQVAVCGVRDQRMVAAATGGADPVISAAARLRRIPGEAVDRAGNEHLMDAAARAGAAFVRLSVVGASAQHPMELFRAHLTLNEVAAIIAQLTGCRSAQHVPRSALGRWRS